MFAATRWYFARLLVLSLVVSQASALANEHHSDGKAEPTSTVLVEDCFSKGAIAIEAHLLGEPCLLKLDTGAVYTTLHKHMRSRFIEAGISPVSEIGLVGAAGKRLRAEVFPSQSIAVDDVELQMGTSLVCLSSSGGKSRHNGRRIDGNLGIDVLQHYRLLVDHDQQTVKLWTANDDSWRSSDWVCVPLVNFATFGEVTTFGVRASSEQGVSTTLLVDTGNSNELTLSRENYLKWEESGRITALGRNQLRGIGGQFESRFGRLDELHLGPFAHHSLEVTAARQNAIGYGYLWQFACLFDFPDGCLYLKPGKRFGRGNCFDLDGLELPKLSYLGVMLSSSTVVRDVRPGSPAEAIGLHKGDVLRSLGDLKLRSYPLTALYRHVRWADGDEFDLRVQRGDEEFTLTLPVTSELASVVQKTPANMCITATGRASHIGSNCSSHVQGQRRRILRTFIRR